MALLDEKLDPRFSSGKIGGPPTLNLPQLSAGKIGGPPTVRSFPNVHTSPSADHSGEFMGNTRNVLEQGGADVRKAYEQGGIGPAVGMLARAATAGPLAVLDDLTPSMAAPRDALGTFLTGKVAAAAAPSQKGTPAPTAEVPAPGAPEAPPSAAEKPARAPGLLSRPVPGTDGVVRIEGVGKSPLFTNLDPTLAAEQMRSNPVGVIPAGASPFGGGGLAGEVGAALQAAAARGDWDAVRQHYQRNGGTWQGKTAAQEGVGGANVLEWDKLVDADKVQEARSKLLETLTNVQPGRTSLSKNQATLLMQLLGQNQQGNLAQAELAQRTKQQADALGIQQGNLDVARQQAGTHNLTAALQAALAGNQIEDSKEIRTLRQKYLNAKTPEEAAAAARALLLVHGKDPRGTSDEVLKARSALFGDAVKGVSSGMLNGPDGKALTLDQLLAQGQQFIAGSQAPAAATPQVIAVGQVADGYRYKGGDPKKESSWEAVK